MTGAHTSGNASTTSNGAVATVIVNLKQVNNDNQKTTAVGNTAQIIHY